ncbi:MAG: B-box zinc finger [Desulfatitalea sp. BRH_c12]|nr:MAG: B-box zinc finger [Desulfatitalea sp. BRH_c12]
MGQCSCHPEIETQYICMKYNTYLCEECLTCRDPELYCKYRPSCLIWFMTKRQKRREQERK